MSKLTRADKKQRGVRADDAIVPSDNYPDCPDGTTTEVAMVWNRKAPILFKTGRLGPHNIDEFREYCELVVECDFLRKQIKEHNESRLSETSYLDAHGNEKIKLSESPWSKLLLKNQAKVLEYSKLFKVSQAELIDFYTAKEDDESFLD